MNKKVNTIIFLCAASVFCIVITAMLFLGILAGAILILQKVLAPEVFAFIALAVFAASVILSYFIYKAVLNAIGKRIDFEKYFDPLISSGLRAPRNPRD